MFNLSIHIQYMQYELYIDSYIEYIRRVSCIKHVKPRVYRSMLLLYNVYYIQLYNLIYSLYIVNILNYIIELYKHYTIYM